VQQLKIKNSIIKNQEVRIKKIDVREEMQEVG
jgi:hypothetical protein